MTKYNIVTDLLKKKLPPIEYILENLIPEGSITYVHGAAGTCKTFFVMQTALCAAAGIKEFFGFKVKPCKVLFIDEENGERRIKQRIEQMCKKLKIPQKDLDGRLAVWTFDDFSLTDDKLDELFAFCKEFDPKMICVDSIAKVFTGDENDSMAVRRIFSKLKPFMKENVAFPVIHHSRKLNDRRVSVADDMAGSREFKAQASSVISLSEVKTNLYLLKQTKNRDGKQVDSINFTILSGDDGVALGACGKAADNVKIAKEKAVEIMAGRILKLLAETTEGKLSVTELKAALGSTHNQVYPAIALLLSKDRMDIVKKGTKYALAGVE